MNFQLHLFHRDAADFTKAPPSTIAQLRPYLFIPPAMLVVADYGEDQSTSPQRLESWSLPEKAS